jgi:hypothetical protein
MENHLALLQNIATNGRWFCALLVLANISAQHHGLAILSAAPVGLSCIVDQLPASLARPASIAVYAFTVIVAVASLLALG